MHFYPHSRLNLDKNDGHILYLHLIDQLTSIVFGKCFDSTLTNVKTATGEKRGHAETYTLTNYTHLTHLKSITQMI